MIRYTVVKDDTGESVASETSYAAAEKVAKDRYAMEKSLHKNMNVLDGKTGKPLPLSHYTIYKIEPVFCTDMTQEQMNLARRNETGIIQ
jgi:hypothetical protein